MKINYYAKTDIGKIRKENQDSYGILQARDLFFICDGMGGAASGDFASRSAVEIILKSFGVINLQNAYAVVQNSKGLFEEDAITLIASIRLANRALYNFTEVYHKLSGMGTTFASVLFDRKKNIVHICHVGDSRVYRLRNGVFQQLTKDHSKVNELIDQGKITEEEATISEIKSMITRALGTQATVEIDYRVENVIPNDLFVLCTDGLCGEVDEAAIKKVVVENSSNISQVCKQLVNLANNSSGRDNTTVIALRTEGDITDSCRYNNKISFGDVVTIGQETQEEAITEDSILRTILRKTKIKIPKEAKEKGILKNPLCLGIFIATIISGIVFFFSRMPEKKPETELIDLTGRIVGIKPEVRVPLKEQIKKFTDEKDKISKIEMIQDWYKYKDKNTQPLHGVELIIEKDDKKQKYLTGMGPSEIILTNPGTYTLHSKYHGYKIISATGELLDATNVLVESAKQLEPVLLIMIPVE
ncbi:MAG: protein phosphatase 2C domain-containing protein [Elusimicrobiota bacterium]